tara:strand:+ start:14291 stop:15448 length:1158 start_codon:yes stop_codon:yes gene_type:complete
MNNRTNSVPTHVLDFLRGFAAVYVLINHTRGNFFMGGGRVVAEASGSLGLYDYTSLALLQATALGTEFVIMFFCISGFSMAHSIQGTSSPFVFYLRRAIRLWPPYIMAVALAAFVCWAVLQLSPEGRYASCATALCTLTGLLQMVFYIKVSTPITAQFWSLPYEVIFYVLCPLLLWRIAAIPLIYAATVVLSVIGIAMYGYEINPASSVLVNFAINAAFWFMSGVMAYHFLDRLPKLKPPLFWAATATLFIAVLGIKLAFGGSNAFGNFLMIVLTLLCLTSLPRSITARPLWNWGFFSYSIYIFHVAFLVLISLMLEALFGIRGSDISNYWAWILVLPPVLFGCWALYLISERPTNALLRRMKRKQRPVSSGTSPGMEPSQGRGA